MHIYYLRDNDFINSDLDESILDSCDDIDSWMYPVYVNDNISYVFAVHKNKQKNKYTIGVVGLNVLAQALNDFRKKYTKYSVDNGYSVDLVLENWTYYVLVRKDGDELLYPTITYNHSKEQKNSIESNNFQRELKSNLKKSLKRSMGGFD